MDAESLRSLISEKVWQETASRLQSEETIEVMRELFDYAVDRLAPRLDDIKVQDGRAIAFFSSGREILTINVTRKDLRIYIHPPAGAFFDPNEDFDVERFSLWKGSFQKKSGKYKAMSVWISEKKYLAAVKRLIDRIPRHIGE